MRFSPLIIGILFGLLTACSRGGSGGTDDNNNGNDPHVFNPQDLTAPNLVINTPVLNQVYTSGNTIQVIGRVTDDLGLYRGTIRIIDDVLGADVKQQNYEIHGLKAYDYNFSHILHVTAPTDFTVVVFFEDHGYNGNTKTVKIRVNP